MHFLQLIRKIYYMRFLGNVMATIIGIFIFFMLFFFGIVLIGALFGGESEGVEIKKNSVIELDLKKYFQ